MQRQNRAARLVPAMTMFLAMLCASCAGSDSRSSAPSAPRPDSSTTSLPEWLRLKIGEFETLPADRAPLGVWRITHNGQPAFYLLSACCDQYNPLFNAEGTEICNPSGGFTGRGDGKCPKPMDQGTKAALVWSHPAATSQTDEPPGLMRD
ncbi:DUF6970 domain-containing protein [Pseudoxanthomonas sacheonensis]|uniref:DUF6970 domain-containing protein n=1 Tax=Pseudoxanthomonas sacheonensis TaxID=443615 RepID=A0ABU1RWU2_9GAMM|nr:hypothetical protein [Pseudoxanthomonas sacheonensis]MDR6843220.1 hypothetical protein [Pseudoxanthomonas sacheonensis]